jgi:hypothetical protein
MQRHAGRHMTQPSIAQKLTSGSERPLEVFWGKGDEAKALFRECEEIISRKYGSTAVASTKPAEPARKPRKPTLASLLKQATKAGKSVKGAEVYQDRTVLQFGEPEPIEPDNPWFADLSKETKQ